MGSIGPLNFVASRGASPAATSWPGDQVGRAPVCLIGPIIYLFVASGASRRVKMEERRGEAKSFVGLSASR